MPALRRRTASTNWPTPECSTATAISTLPSEYAKAAPEDILIRITIENRGPEAARAACAADALVSQYVELVAGRERPAAARSSDRIASRPLTRSLGDYRWLLEEEAPLLFTENETNAERALRLRQTRSHS